MFLPTDVSVEAALHEGEKLESPQETSKDPEIVKNLDDLDWTMDHGGEKLESPQGAATTQEERVDLYEIWEEPQED